MCRVLVSTHGFMSELCYMCVEGLEGYFRDSGFDQNTVRESGKR